MQLTQPYQAYTYAYPHKTAYRPFTPRSLTDVWQAEPTEDLFLYIHIPFCDIRCGFCNLFTTTNPEKSFPTQYLDALQRQADATRQALPNATIAQIAIGGGTPTYLSPTELERVVAIATDTFGADLHKIPVSVETSPQTATPDRLAVLRAAGIDRISIGVQSTFDAELKGIGRPQRNTVVETALSNMRGFPTRNVDLIYGNPEQTEASWLETLKQTLEHAPEQLYLYPLYVRPLTGMSKMDQDWDDLRLRLYYVGRDYLREQGYEQRSMRHFQRVEHQPLESMAYACQTNGMIGLGCGARSYTSTLHYSSEYAVGRRAVRDILSHWITRDFTQVDYGFTLDHNEQLRRYLLKSLLNTTGLDKAAFKQTFGIAAHEVFPTLAQLPAYIVESATHWQLTETGLAWSDAIGPLFYSDTVQQLSTEFSLV